jgi:hypothetical protein
VSDADKQVKAIDGRLYSRVAIEASCIVVTLMIDSVVVVDKKEKKKNREAQA